MNTEEALRFIYPKLSPYENIALSHLITKKEYVPARKLALLTGIPRTKMYDTLKNLDEMDLINYDYTDNWSHIKLPDNYHDRGQGSRTTYRKTHNLPRTQYTQKAKINPQAITERINHLQNLLTTAKEALTPKEEES